MIRRRCVFAGLIGLLTWTHVALAQSSESVGRPINLAWDANGESWVRGYIVFVGTDSDAYSSQYDVGNATSFSFTTGIAGRKYFFAVAAYADGPLVGPMSSEVSATVVAVLQPTPPSDSLPAPEPGPIPTPEPTSPPEPEPTSPPAAIEPPAAPIEPPAVPVAMTSNGGSCRALPAPTGRTITITPAQASSLGSTLASAQAGDTIQFADGQYAVTETLVVAAPGVTLRSLSGNRDAVILDGSYLLDELIVVRASDVVVADLTLTRAKNRAIRVRPSGSNVYGTLLHNIHVVDSLAAAVSIEPFAGFYADNGVLECSALELSDAGRAASGSRCDTGGISADGAANWQIEVNTLSGFWCSSGAAQPAIRFAAGSRGTVVDRAVIVNSARGIVLGAGGLADRTYGDEPCAGNTAAGHYGGAVLNNTVAASDPRLFASEDGFQSGISLERSCGTNVVHNTVASAQPPRASSIEWRSSGTVATVANNLVSHALVAGDGAQATTGGNITGAPLAVFKDAPSGDLHLTARAVGAIDAAATLSPSVGWDLDGAPRSAPSDVGADEFSGIRFNLTTPAQVTAQQALTVTWTADPAIVTSSDWIGLFAAGVSDLVPADKTFTAGQPTGTASLTAPAAPGSYEVRYFTGSSPLRVASSPVITVIAAPPPPPAPSTASFTVSVAGVIARKAPLPITWSADPLQATAGDWIGLFAVGASDLVPVAKKLTGGQTQGTATLIAPATAGTYELRYISGGFPKRLATSSTITVTP